MHSTPQQTPRDFVGHGPEPPPPYWPDGARVAVAIVVNVEAGAERSTANGHERDDIPGGWSPLARVAGRSQAAESDMEYGARAGVWRILRILARHQVQATIFANGVALERNPRLAQALAGMPHEVANHGYWWQDHSWLDRGEEERLLQRGTASLAATTGRRPTGWYSRDGASPSSRSLIRGHGYRYDANTFNDDVPFTVTVDGAPHPVVPYTGDLNDTRLLSDPMPTAAHFARVIDDALHQLLAERPRAAVVSIGLHPRLIGRPGYAVALDQVLARHRRDPALWFATMGEIADRVAEHGQAGAARRDAEQSV